MASANGVGVVYELDFLINDKTARTAIDKMLQHAQKFVDTLDKVSLKRACDEAKRWQSELKRTETAQEKIKRYNDVLGKSVKNPFDKVKKGANDTEKAIGTMLKKIGTGALYNAGAMLTQGLSQSFQDFSSIDFNVRGASAKSGGFGKDYKDYIKLVNQVGGNTRFTNMQTSEALNAGATLGIKKEEMMQMLPATAQLAQAFNTDIPKAMEVTKMHMNTYSLAGKDAQRVTDMIAVTSRNSAADIDRLSEGFKYVGGKAKALNIPLEQVYAVLGKMNDSGFTGSTAGTSFNMFLSNITKGKKRAMLEDTLGKKITNSKGDLLELSQILTMISEKTKTMGTADRAGFLNSVFGERGGRVMDVFLNQGVEGMKKLQDEIKNSEGAAKAMSDYMMSGSAGAIETFTSTMESAFQSTFQSLSPLIVPVAGALTLVAQGIITINEKVPMLGEFLAIMSAFVLGKAILPLIIGKLKLIGGLVKTAFSSPGLIALTIGLVILFELFRRWKQYLSENQEANRQWQEILFNGKEILKSVGGAIWEIIKALFGLTDSQQKAGKATGITKDKTATLADKMKEFKVKLTEVNLKIRDFTKWVSENGTKVKETGEKILIFIGILTGLSIINGIITMIEGMTAALTTLGLIAPGVGATVGASFTAMLGPIGAVILALAALYLAYKLADKYNSWDMQKEKARRGEYTGSVMRNIAFEKEFKKEKADKINNTSKNAIKSGAGKAANAGAAVFKKKAVGTDNFMAGSNGGMTHIDEQGDEAIWLPNGSMVARNTTTRQMLGELKSINSKSNRGSSGTKATYVSFGDINITSNDGRKVANELLDQLSQIGVV